MTKTILTGLRANSTLTLGNYLGAILPMVKIQNNLQDRDKLFLFIPDLHSFVTPINHQDLYQSCLNNVKIYIAAGINPYLDNIFLYRQSYIPAHSELTWILSCFSYYGEMQRMTQFKDKSASQGHNISVGLFTYPILMAADILLYDANYVPVGEDQKQHLELTRNVGLRMNQKFKDIFPEGLFQVPEAWDKQLEFMNLEEGVRIRSLTKPESKMSKSVEDPKGTIILTEEPKHAAKKIMGATTDNLGQINWDWQNQPGITNLLQLHSLFREQSFEETRNLWIGQNSYGNLKKEVASLVSDFLSDFQKKLKNISDYEAEETLQAGERKAAKMANRTLYKVQRAVGIRKC